MAVRRHELKLLVLDHHQQAVEIVADVLLRHGVLHQTEQPSQSFLAQRKAGHLARRPRKTREVLRWERLQRESTLARLDQQALILLLERYFRAVGKGTQDIDKLSRAEEFVALRFDQCHCLYLLFFYI